MSSSSSSNGSPTFALLNGATSAAPDVIAGFRVGDNSMRLDGIPELVLGDNAADWTGSAGHITWDASYQGGENDFFSVAPVHLRIDREMVRWSVGTTDFVARRVHPFTRIKRVQVVAASDGGLPDVVVKWDLLEVKFCSEEAEEVLSGTHSSPCLPRVSSKTGLRRGMPQSGFIQQYTDIVGPADASGFELRGQVALSSRGNQRTLSANALQGKVLIFTE